MSGKGKQDRDKRDRRAKDMSIDPAPPAWVSEREASDPSWNENIASPVYVAGDSFEAQIFQRTRRNPSNGRLVDFAIGVQIRSAGTDEGWVDVVRVDCAVGAVHVDRCHPNGKTEKDFACVPKNCRDNLDKAFKWAQGYCWDTDVRLEEWA